ncbi:MULTISPECIES: type II secretion system protein [unclassified Photobacterium]|uniref:PilW family protein n=1 Tax=unclassified Photobacterium TaxID=2628852 RepID=UPI001EDF31D1|nr:MULTISPECIES: type II secretion system protein [unclassified Photobacterium]MCG3862834.1 type II secretion system protein [Photobacterium sp. Ph6]MCG3874301.1 type II secretion system protein [Photobacterium sp. Ph5]
MAKQRGFTLFEMVIAIVVLSIIMIGIGSYIAIGVKGYTNTVDRERLQSQARFLVARMTKEIRHAAPNSLSISGSQGSKNRCLSFYPIVSSAVYYTDSPNGSDELNVSPFDPDNTDVWRLNTDWNVAVGFASADQYQDNNVVMSGAEEYTTSENKGLWLLSLKDSNKITTSSPGKRLYLYKNKISYCQVGNTIERQVNDTDGIVMASDVEMFTPTVQTAGLNSNAIAFIGIEFKDPRTNETADYNHSVQVLNVL